MLLPSVSGRPPPRLSLHPPTGLRGTPKFGFPFGSCRDIKQAI